MKFYTTISNRTKQLLLLWLLAFSAIDFQAQNISSSPYSRFGIGELQAIQNPKHIGMGGLSIALIGANNITIQNPASYLNLDSLSVVFDVSMQAAFSRLTEKQPNSEISSANTNSASLGQISFTFPITSWLKSSFGLTPNSNMSYDVTREYSDQSNIGKYRLNNAGQGGLNRVFLGVALGTSRISFGANANFQFGSFVRNAYLMFSDTILIAPTTTMQSKSLDARGLSWNLGFQYKQPLSKRYLLGVGLTYTPRYNLSASRRVQAWSLGALNDTISLGKTEDGTLKMPDAYAIGLSFERLNRWVIGVEYSAINFKNYQEFSEHDPNLVNAYTFRVGGELIGQRSDNNFMSRLSYRLGYHYGTNYVAFQNSELKQMGVSFGVGVPIRRSQSRIDFAIEVGRKGQINAGQIQENYGRIVIGIFAFDRWFMRGKFD